MGPIRVKGAQSYSSAAHSYKERILIVRDFLAIAPPYVIDDGREH